MKKKNEKGSDAARASFDARVHVFIFQNFIRNIESGFYCELSFCLFLKLNSTLFFTNLWKGLMKTQNQ